MFVLNRKDKGKMLLYNISNMGLSKWKLAYYRPFCLDNGGMFKFFSIKILKKAALLMSNVCNLGHIIHKNRLVSA